MTIRFSVASIFLFVVYYRALVVDGQQEGHWIAQEKSNTIIKSLNPAVVGQQRFFASFSFAKESK
jgi:hypothetical protein